MSTSELQDAATRHRTVKGATSKRNDDIVQPIRGAEARRLLHRSAIWNVDRSDDTRFRGVPRSSEQRTAFRIPVPVDSRHAQWTAFPVSIPPPPPPPPPSLPPAPGHEQPYWNGQQPYGYQQQPRTNGLAIAALVGGLVLAPLGIVLGHIALSQIKRSGEQGRGLALAGLIIGYIFTTLMVLSIVWLMMIANAVSSAFDNFDSDTYSSDYYATQTSQSYSTYASTAPTYDSASTAEVIENASVGDCVSRILGSSNGDGTNSVTVTEASCGSASATHRVTSRGSRASDCSYDWVSTDNPIVVLCLTEQ